MIRNPFAELPPRPFGTNAEALSGAARMRKRDLRNYASQTNLRLVAGFFVIILVVGVGLIYTFWGQPAAVTALICVAGALIPAVLVWLVLELLGWVVKKVND